MTTSLDFWEDHYDRRPPTPRPRPNPILVREAARLTPGVALDVGCGEGGDALWLADQGWRVTAVDVSSTALKRLDDSASVLGLSDRITAEQHDATMTLPRGRFDLVTAQYFQTPVRISRDDVLRRAAAAVRPGGHLLVVDHGSTTPWSWNQHEHEFPTADHMLRQLALGPPHWRPVRVEDSTRETVGPGGQRATVIDTVLLLRRSRLAEDVVAS